MISPGPWGATCCGVTPDNGARIVHLRTGHPLGDAVDDARLIESAPELLNILSRIVNKSYLRPGKFEDCQVQSRSHPACSLDHRQNGGCMISLGPWRQLPLGDFGSVNVVAVDGKPVAFTGTKGRSEEENQANARLIAGAPELLEACRVALQHILGGPAGRQRAIELLDAAIRRTE